MFFSEHLVDLNPLERLEEAENRFLFFLVALSLFVAACGLSLVVVEHRL